MAASGCQRPHAPAVPPVSVAAAAQSCLAEIGPEAAGLLVRRCIQVSPATHPPCNAQNACAMIQGEIDRSCAFLPAGSEPGLCGTASPAR